MIKSFCIKSNNYNIIYALIAEIEKIDLSNIFISQKKFLIYENIIIHYSGKNLNNFYSQLAHTLTKIIIKYYEKKLIQKNINENYFYFFEHEKKDIINTCLQNLNEFNYAQKYTSIYEQCLSYIKQNKSMIFEGFIRFRLYNYLIYIDEFVNYNINKYLIQKEYFEFIKLLKNYISNSKSNCTKIHLIYSNKKVTLLNENKIIIPIENNISNSKFLSDISFSQNDYCLNTLLTILPEKITLHLLTTEDEFIKTIKLIFKDRLIICNSCTLCKESQNNYKI